MRLLRFASEIARPFVTSTPTYPLGSLSVLESVDNDHDRALDILLGMNDPTYVSSTVPNTPNRSASRASSVVTNTTARS